MYTETCNFIHFTSRHIFASVGKLNDDLYFQVSAEDPPRAELGLFRGCLTPSSNLMKLTIALARGFARKRAKNPPPPEGPDIEPVR